VGTAAVLLGSLPAFLLLVWFVVTSFAALRRLRISAWLVVVGFVTSAAVFTYDAVTRNINYTPKTITRRASEDFSLRHLVVVR
jgi:hypothetical protein